ncbi:hypothetical protein IU459_34945 [Nocardia amamiensis]|uniref:SMODS-associating 2TM beta-strand rich effector domain-containing protein n=1 Tax=Nocardia amamiensis TaxID=404578 RepID=A0ABS0D1H5_9NOCA|nr:hypothetical protein [Nocardia amamiensis]MBF6302692.1 hypothetical protein [Nocardia amamiensis]
MIRKILDKLFPLAVFVAAAATGSGLCTAVQQRAWLDITGCLVTATVLFFLTRSWQRDRRAWWRTAEYQTRHTAFLVTLTELTATDPYTAWHAGARQWLGVTVCTTPCTAIFSGRRYFEVVVADAPEPSLASGTDIEFDYVTMRCFLVFRRNPCIDIYVTGELVDPRTGDRHPGAGVPRGTLRTVIRRLRTPPAARLAGSSDIDALLERLATAEPREHH